MRLAAVVMLFLSASVNARAACDAPEYKSLNSWDPARKAWCEFRIGSDGLVLELTGALQGKAMVMTGELPSAKGGTQRQRVSWTPRDDGSVVQLWEASDAAGRTWAPSFHGLYRRKPAP